MATITKSSEADMKRHNRQAKTKNIIAATLKIIAADIDKYLTATPIKEAIAAMKPEDILAKLKGHG